STAEPARSRAQRGSRRPARRAVAVGDRYRKHGYVEVACSAEASGQKHSLQVRNTLDKADSGTRQKGARAWAPSSLSGGARERDRGVNPSIPGLRGRRCFLPGAASVKTRSAGSGVRVEQIADR